MLARKILGVGLILSFLWGWIMLLVGLSTGILALVLIQPNGNVAARVAWSTFSMIAGTLCIYGAIRGAEHRWNLAFVLTLVGGLLSMVFYITFVPTLAMIMWLLMITVCIMILALQRKVR